MMSIMFEKVDYVLVYEHPDYKPELRNEASVTRMETLRRRFSVAMKKESLEIEDERVGKYVFVKIFCSKERLYQEAEEMRVELPVHGVSLKNPEKKEAALEKKMGNLLNGDDRSDVQITAPFQKKCIEVFQDENSDDGPRLWSSLRSLITYNILININIARKGENESDSSFQGLAYLLMVGAYKEAFVTHDPSAKEPVSLAAVQRPFVSTEQDAPSLDIDLRRVLAKTWGRGLCRRQPLQLIRDYFGEKIAFYFAWVSIFIDSLWIPTILGLGVFIFGVTRRYQYPKEKGILRYIDIVKNSSDNTLTPGFAAIICLWGTILMEIWKRRQIFLAHRWHVENFDMVEPDRPQFYGTHDHIDPLTSTPRKHYPFLLRMLKYCSSAAVLLFMVLLVFISVTSVILYRVYMTVSICAVKDGLCSLLHGTVLATFLNTVSIMILGRIYESIAVKLTDWENHRTTSTYNDALIIKLYAFQFANTYTSLFYTAFFRRDFGGVGILGMGPEYTDNCGKADNDNCMSLLSFQLLVLMVVKPFPKFFRDVLLPFFKKCFRGCCINEINDVRTDRGVSKMHPLLREKQKPSAEDFRLSEFTEKMIQYGYLMLFAASFPLAPLLALIFNVIDLRVDARRLLWWTKRPTPFRDNDIGIWFNIINFINVCAVISNAFLIAFNSELGRDQSLEIKFAIVIGFEHFVFVMKYGISMLIPDVPTWVKNSQKKERFLISYLMSKWRSPEQGHNSDDFNGRAETLNNTTGTKREDLPKSRWSYG